MRSFTGISHLLLDIEGTTCPVSFVAEVLFPYATARLNSFLQERHLIPAAPHAVGAPDLADLHFVRMLFCQTRDPARKVARRRVVFAPEARRGGARTCVLVLAIAHQLLLVGR